jgi:hypothetical protein
MRDDAVAPVIAVMLILAAVATLFVIFNGAYIPSLKEAAEIEHIRNVESSFQQVTSYIGQVVALRQNSLTVSEPVQLGGGDIFLNSLKSGGSLSVITEDKPVYYLILNADKGNQVIMNGTIVNITYTSVGNFWQDQGYRWQYGFLNVTKYGTKQAPISYSTMSEVDNEFNGSGTLAAFASSFGDVTYSANQTYYQNATPTSDNRFSFSPRQGNCSRLVLTAVNITASPDYSFTSGNGDGRIEMSSRIIPQEHYGVTSITIVSDMKPFGTATASAWNESFSALAETCKNNIEYNPDKDYSGEGYNTYTVSQQVSPVNVTLNIVSIGIGVR